jgi:hypothetical protein
MVKKTTKLLQSFSEQQLPQTAKFISYCPDRLNPNRTTRTNCTDNTLLLRRKSRKFLKKEVKRFVRKTTFSQGC